MKKVFLAPAVLLLGITGYMFFWPDCLPEKSFAATGKLFDRPIQTTADSELAALMVSNNQDGRVRDFYREYQGRKPDTKTLAEISGKYSADTATFYFLQETYRQKPNKEAQDLYSDYYRKLASSAAIPELKNLREYFIVFIPGLAYKEDTTTGADFARQIKLLTAAGIPNQLIETGEWDSSDNNAGLIAARLRELSKQHKKIMVVSASKGGLETAIALGKLMQPEETGAIKSWVNVGGILRGSPVADQYLTEPACWFAILMLWTKGKKVDLVEDISYEKRSADFHNYRFPENIKIINFVGVPLATQISNEIKGRYCSMIEFGPNDGLTPIADEVADGGIIVSEVGLDHYFRDKDIDKKTLSLALTAVKISLK